MSESETTAENVAQTVADLMREVGHHGEIYGPMNGAPILGSHLVTIPAGRKVEDLTRFHREAREYFQPLRRTGTARLKELESLISWANRFKDNGSVLYASPDQKEPTLTCVADYHLPGPADPEIDKTARYGHHRAIYDFPLSDEWKAWMAVSGKALEKDPLGEFIEANAKDIIDPTPAIISMSPTDQCEPWETSLIRTAQQIDGRFGQLHQLLALSKRFQVFETSDLKVATNRDTGEAEIQFLNEHKDAAGAPLNIPNLIIIAIPVFRNGAAYRMPVRFRYRKAGASVNFVLKIYNPERAFEDAFNEAVRAAMDATGLPCFHGTPESL